MDDFSRRVNPLISNAPSASRGLGRLTLDVRQDLPPWKQSAFVGASLIFGLAISIAILAAAGIPPLTLASELAGVLTAENLRGVLVQAAPLILVGLGASLAFRIVFGNLGIEARLIFGCIFDGVLSIYELVY